MPPSIHKTAKTYPIREVCLDTFIKYTQFVWCGRKLLGAQVLCLHEKKTTQKILARLQQCSKTEIRDQTQARGTTSTRDRIGAGSGFKIETHAVVTKQRARAGLNFVSPLTEFVPPWRFQEPAERNRGMFDPRFKIQQCS